MANGSDKLTAMWVLRRLRAAGFEAFFAGGCVRDLLLGRRANDYDVATNATPPEVARVFRRVLMVGAKFGVCIVLHRRRQVEVATFRRDLSYSDGRRPDEVRFSSPRQDALRRDFTINGMFYDPLSEKTIDYVGGREDIKKRVIRTIGSAEKRFSEDYLRMLRAVRFAAALDFTLVPATSRVIGKLAGKIRDISGERIFDELTKILSNPRRVEALEHLERLNLAGAILPELFDQSGGDGESLWSRALTRVGKIGKSTDPTLAVGALLMDLPPGVVGKIIRRWGGSNELKSAIRFFASNRDGWRDAADRPLCEFKRLLSDERWEMLRRLWAIRERRETGRDRRMRQIARRAGAIAPGQISPPPFVTGDDLIRMGLKESKRLGRILRTLRDGQLNEELQTRRAAQAMARKLIADR